MHYLMISVVYQMLLILPLINVSLEKINKTGPCSSECLPNRMCNVLTKDCVQCVQNNDCPRDELCEQSKCTPLWESIGIALLTMTLIVVLPIILICFSVYCIALCVLEVKRRHPIPLISFVEQHHSPLVYTSQTLGTSLALNV